MRPFWQHGRQGGGYKKRLLFQSQRLRCDCWLLFYPQGSHIPPHCDPAQAGAHHRINIILWKPDEGGVFKAATPVRSLLWGRIILFRPDLVEHSVSPLEKGSRLVLSFGWLTGHHP